MKLDAWLVKHPYLQSLADLHAKVAAVAADVAVPTPVPDFAGYAEEFRCGTPLLDSKQVAIDLAATEPALTALVDRLLSQPLPAQFEERCRGLAADLRATTRVAEALPDAVTSEVLSYGDSGLLRYLTWAVLARQLSPIVEAFAAWRDEERWLHNYCPMCGEPPAMAQLVSRDSSRLRLLACGCCETRWRYRRTGCPFCEDPDDHRLSVIAVQGEKSLRIDYCQACAGYLKTYDGEGSEHVMLLDWTSIHLDLLARERGLKRLAASLYEI